MRSWFVRFCSPSSRWPSTSRCRCSAARTGLPFPPLVLFPWLSFNALTIVCSCNFLFLFIVFGLHYTPRREMAPGPPIPSVIVPQALLFLPCLYAAQECSPLTVFPGSLTLEDVNDLIDRLCAPVPVHHEDKTIFDHLGDSLQGELCERKGPALI